MVRGVLPPNNNHLIHLMGVDRLDQNTYGNFEGWRRCLKVTLEKPNPMEILSVSIGFFWSKIVAQFKLRLALLAN